MTKFQKIKSIMAGATAAAMNHVNGDLSAEIDDDELAAMGKGEEHEEESDVHE